MSYRTRAVPLGLAVSDISRAAGISAGVSDELSSAPVIVDVHSAPLGELMTHLAEAIGGEWESGQGGEYYLSRPSALAAQLAEKATLQRKAGLERAVARLEQPSPVPMDTDDALSQTATSLAGALKVLEADPRTSEGYVNLRPVVAILARSPAHQTLIKALRNLPLDTIASMQPGDRLVFSSEPRGLQLPLVLPHDVQDGFSRAQSIFAKDFEAARKAALAPYERQAAEATRSPSGRVTFVISIERPDSGYGPPSVSLAAKDSAQEIVGYASLRLSVAAGNQPDAEAPASEPEVQLSADSKDVLLACRAADQAGPGTAPAAQVNLLLNPITRDPLSFVASDEFFQIASAQRGNLIAAPTDSVVWSNWPSANGKAMKPSSFLSNLSRWGLRVTIHDGWTIAMPEDIVEEGNRRLSRALLQACFDDFRRQGAISIQSAAALAAAQASPAKSDLAAFYRSLSSSLDPFNSGNKLLLSLYESLAEPQLNAIRGGGRIPFVDLSDMQRRLIDELVLRDDTKLTQNEAGVPGGSGGPGDRSEMLVGLPAANAYISGRTTESQKLLVDLQDTGWELAVEMDADGLGRTAALLDSKAKNPPPEPYPSGFHHISRIGWIAPTKVIELAFVFQLNAHLAAEASLKEAIVGTERWSMNTLPEATARAVHQAYAKAMDSEAQAVPDAAKPSPEPNP